ncbi:hypothetical protein EUX98_g3913 [Antrodiella citrinella]|uniref:Polynucleotide 5'-hydroxyl-kinase GRC3 n=1 Tax=Antrodiella citrinella TaxID=2447956 RepID=A0A4V3XIS7_9APHY|nr:hypothetical protein EUX98_g3913 [Antrodiella citrinella]
MLSAVAARKSRLQQQNASGTASPALRLPSPPEEEPAPKSAGVSQKSRSKRKASAVQTTPRNKKSKPSHAKDSRYFQTLSKDDDTPDLIIIDDDNVSDNDGLSDVSDDDSSTGLASPAPTRAWSPSAVQSNDVAMEDDYFLTTPARKSRPAFTSANSSFSTYTPVSGRNFYPLSIEELGSLSPQSGSSDRQACIVLISPSERLALLGAYRLRLLHGLIMLAGVTLRPSSTSHRVFAPKCAAIPVIEALSQAADEEDITADLPERVAAVINQFSAAVLLEELETGVDGLGKVCRTFEDVFAPPKSRTGSSEQKLGLHGVSLITFPPQGVHPYVLPVTWEASLTSTVPDVVLETDYSRKAFLVKGAKKSGKSTFARTIMNKLSTNYRYVAFLECDLGQSEFTPGGIVSLNVISSPVFGPPFTHPTVPYQAHYIGSTTPQSSPSRYLAAIQALIHTYNTDLQHSSYGAPAAADDNRIDDFIPLVVNMMGWTKGLGADLSDRIEEMLQPSVVYEFEALTFDDGWATPAPYRGDAAPRYEMSSSSAPSTFPVHRLPPISLPPSRYSPADLRQLSILSYFHAVFPSSEGTDSTESPCAQSWDTSLPLCAQPPYEISCESALDLVVLAGPGSEDVVPTEVSRVLNGAIVALVSCEPGSLEVEPDRSTGVPYVQGTLPPLPTSSTCHGLALIRAVSSPSSSPSPPLLLHMLTPVPLQNLVKTQPRVLVKGDMELPVWGMLDFRSETHIGDTNKMEVPYLKWGVSEVVGANKRRARRNLMRKGQM